MSDNKTSENYNKIESMIIERRSMFTKKPKQENILITLEEQGSRICVQSYAKKAILMRMDVIVDGCTLHINDFYFMNPLDERKYINKGIGSKMMNLLIEYAKEQGYKEIKGELSEEHRKDHGNRLHHFYRKNGFDIIYKNPQTSYLYADIIKKLY